MDANITLNALTLVVAALGIVNGWVVVIIRANAATIKSLRDTDVELGRQIGAIRELVAGKYLTRDEFQATMTAQTATFARGLERIESQIDNKADRRAASQS